MKALGKKEGALHGEFALAGQRAPDGSRKKNSDGHRDHCARSAFGAGLSFAAGVATRFSLGVSWLKVASIRLNTSGLVVIPPRC